MNYRLEYIRVSRDTQKNGLDAQRMRLASSRGNGEIVEEFVDEGEGARDIPFAVRPNASRCMARAMELRQAGHSVTICAVRIDRIGANVPTTVPMFESWHRAGISLRLEDFGDMQMDSRTSTGRLILSVLVVIAQFEVDLIRERTCASQAFRKSSGLAVSHPRFGWRHVPTGRLTKGGRAEMRAEPDPEQQEWRKAIIEKVRDGVGDSAIAKWLNQQSVPTAMAGLIRRSRVVDPSQGAGYDVRDIPVSGTWTAVQVRRIRLDFEHESAKMGSNQPKPSLRNPHAN